MNNLLLYIILVGLLTLKAQEIDRQRNLPLNQIDIFYSLIEENPDSAIILGSSILKKYPNSISEESLSEISKELGFIYYSKGDISNALDYYNNSLEIKNKLNDTEGVAFLRNEIGVIHRYFGNFDRALSFHFMALKLYESLNDSLNIAYTLNNIGLIHRNLSDTLMALEYYQRAYFIRKAQGDIEGTSESLNNIGSIYFYTGDYENAKIHYQIALKQREKINSNPEEIAGSLNNLGNVYRELGEFEESQSYYEKSLAISKSIMDKKLIAVTNKNLGILFQKQKKYKIALDYFDVAIKLAEEINFARVHAEVLDQLSTLYFEIKDYLKAYLIHKQFHTLTDSIYNTKTALQISKSANQYELEQKEKEIQALELENEKELKIYLSVIIFLLLLFVIVLIFRYKNKININELLKKNEKSLIKAKNDAIKSEKLKSEFLAQVSHEIRTPVNTILNNSSLIEMELADHTSKEIKESFISIGNASNRLIRTIDLVLNLAEVEAGTYAPEFELLEVEEKILHPILLEFKYPAKLKGLDLVLNNSLNRKLQIYADYYTISQVFSNLIDNAIKYTDKGSVKISIYLQKNKLIISVQDTGIGIAEEYLPKLFEKFSQEEQGYTRKYEGNGLGLALVKKYCEINSVRIEVDSKKNKGTTFNVIFEKDLYDRQLDE